MQMQLTISAHSDPLRKESLVELLTTFFNSRAASTSTIIIPDIAKNTRQLIFLKTTD